MIIVYKCPPPQVVRCFEDGDVVHVSGRVDPVEDIDVINFELALADITQIERRCDDWSSHYCTWY